MNLCKLKIYFQNVSGMRTKNKSLFDFSSQCCYDIFVIVETWLNNEFYDSEYFDLNLYHVYRKDRCYVRTGCERGGGILVAVRKELKSYKCTDFIYDELLDQLFIFIPSLDGLICLCCSYIPPVSSKDLYASHVNNILQVYEKMGLNTRFLIFGDFNLNNLVWVNLNDELTPYNVNKDYEINLIDSFLDMDLIQINNIFNKLNKILDLIFVQSSFKTKIYECLFPFSPSNAHHTAIVLELEAMKFIKCTKFVLDKKFDFNNCNFDALNSAICNVDWSNLLYHKSTNIAYDIFLNTFLNICVQYIPYKTYFSSSRRWYTKGLRLLKNKRNKLHKRYLISGSPEVLLQYKQCNKEFNFLNKFLYKQYIINIESNIKSNPNYFWSYIRSKKKSTDIPSSMFYENNTSDNPEVIVNLFANFFRSNFDSSSSSSYCDKFLSSNLDLSLIMLNKTDILEAISRLKNSFQPDNDGLCAFLLKKCSQSLATPLLIIFNKSLSEGLFADRWKLSFITPILKSGNRCDVSNYRSISKLSTISKIFEYAIYKILYFETKSLIIPQQHGFRNNKSTISNLAVFTDFNLAYLELGIQIDTIYTDFSKAFDKIPHFILLKKLYYLGIHSTFHKWLSSYLDNRICIVQIDMHKSVPYKQISGVPQGSILGPLLFNLFINDIYQCFQYSNFLLYADDLKVFSKIESSIDIKRLQSDLDNLFYWCNNNHLKFNLTKCIQITYSRSRNPLFTTYNLGSYNLKIENEVKDLGILFDSKLTFKSHLDYLIPSAYSTLAFLKRNCTEFLDPYTLKLLFTSFVRSKLEYGAIIWSPSTANNILRIEKIQKKFIRFALPHLNYIYPRPTYESYCLHLGMITLEKRRNLQSMMFAFDLIIGFIDCPELLEKILFYVPSRLSLRHRNLFYITLHHKNYALNSPLIRSLSLLNTLNDSNPLEFNASKTNFKNFLLQNMN